MHYVRERKRICVNISVYVCAGPQVFVCQYVLKCLCVNLESMRICPHVTKYIYVEMRKYNAHKSHADIRLICLRLWSIEAI